MHCCTEAALKPIPSRIRTDSFGIGPILGVVTRCSNIIRYIYSLQTHSPSRENSLLAPSCPSVLARLPQDGFS